VFGYLNLISDGVVSMRSFFVFVWGLALRGNCLFV
jgi:hypothetical protein